MIFDYIALNKGNNKVEGEVSAKDLPSARKRLHSMGLTVLAVNERKEEIKKEEKKETKKDFLSFEFKGIDKKGKEIVGTIDAKDSFSAYVRLKKEFFFDVKYMMDLAVDESEQERQKKEWVKELQKKYEATGLSEEQDEHTKEDDDLEELEKSNAAKLEVLRNQVEVMLAQIKAVLEKVKEDSKNRSDLSNIKILIGELERVKMSNNMKHIKGVAERILNTAENLLRDKEGYQVIVKQKKNLDSSNLERIRQQQYRSAVEAKGISSALKHASNFFNKYTKIIGFDSIEKKKDESPKKKQALKQNTEKKENILSDVDLLKKTRKEIAADLKTNFKNLIRFGKKEKADRKSAFMNILSLVKIYFKKPETKKEEKDIQEQKKQTKSSSKQTLNPSKKDYHRVFVELNVFLGWLLCFYLVYFYVGGLIIQKNLSFFKDFFHKTIVSEFLLLLFFSFFIFHLLINLKIKFFRQSFLGGVLLFSLGGFFILFYSINF